MQEFNNESLIRVLEGNVKGGILLIPFVAEMKEDYSLYHYRYADLKEQKLHIDKLVKRKVNSTGNKVISDIVYSDNGGYLKAEFFYYPLYEA